jgi:hypothetical protein
MRHETRKLSWSAAPAVSTVIAVTARGGPVGRLRSECSSVATLRRRPGRPKTTGKGQLIGVRLHTAPADQRRAATHPWP